VTALAAGMCAVGWRQGSVFATRHAPLARMRSGRERSEKTLGTPGNARVADATGCGHREKPSAYRRRRKQRSRLKA
jgi:hypothetical protein